ncbi:MAG: DUF981 family protein [Nanoarchaeota archaeon]|nr:DUF981 family protein [Nanoarchaeota archaeon]
MIAISYNPLAFGLMIVGVGALLFGSCLHQYHKKKLSFGGEKTYGLMFIIIGIITSLFAFIMYFTEPIPKQYIEVYGVGYFMFSILMIVSGTILYKRLDKRPASYLALVSGVILLWTARNIYSYSMSKSPLGTTAIFAFAGLGSMGSYFFGSRKLKDIPGILITLTVLAFVLCGLLALYSGFSAQFGHLGSLLNASS